MLVGIVRNVEVFFGRDKINPADLSTQIKDRLKDRSVERKVYLRVDGRCEYWTVKKVLDGIRAAGIENVGFLLEQPTISH